jgi:hypothetical protein
VVLVVGAGAGVVAGAGVGADVGAGVGFGVVLVGAEPDGALASCCDNVAASWAGAVWSSVLVGCLETVTGVSTLAFGALS